MASFALFGLIVHELEAPCAKTASGRFKTPSAGSIAVRKLFTTRDLNHWWPSSFHQGRDQAIFGSIHSWRFAPLSRSVQRAKGARMKTMLGPFASRSGSYSILEFFITVSKIVYVLDNCIYKRLQIFGIMA